jgi:MtN3 and saliva related transmembrane protein
MSAATEAVGFIAAVLTTSCYVPQVWHTWKTKEVAGISLMMYLALFGGVGFWLVYGVLLGSMPLILSNIFCLSMIGAIMAMKVKFSKTALKSNIS